MQRLYASNTRVTQTIIKMFQNNNLKYKNESAIRFIHFIRENKLKLHSRHDEYLTMLKILNATDTLACL